MSRLNAVVTGGARGIGLGIAKRLHADGFGVVIWDRDIGAFSEAEAGFVPALLCDVDVAVEGSVAVAFERTISACGAIDVLVNNAGIQTRATPIWEYSVETWRSIIDINLTGVFLCTRAVAGHMKDRASGRIINIASVSSKHGGPNICAYAAAKAGVVSLTKSVGKELAPFGVLVNAITPTMIETDLMRSTGAEFVEQGKARIPMGRFGKIEEVAAMVSWLAGRECSFSTAAVFDLSGGTANY